MWGKEEKVIKKKKYIPIAHGAHIFPVHVSVYVFKSRWSCVGGIDPIICKILPGSKNHFPIN